MYITIQIFALTMDECRPGKTVYIDRFVNIEAKIIKRDYSDYTVKVRKIDSGKREWVKPSELMGYISGAIGNKVQEQAVDFMPNCFFGDTCKEKKEY